VRDGGGVIAVRAEDPAAGERASRILDQHGVREAASYAQEL
jgi:hypothetical protein